MTTKRTLLTLSRWSFLFSMIFLISAMKVKHYLDRINREGVARVKMFFIVTIAYLLFWGPLFLVGLTQFLKTSISQGDSY